MDLTNWKWLNESQIMIADGDIAIAAPERTDWFNDPVPKDGKLSAPVFNAPFYYMDVTGDFVFKAKVRPNHRYVYDACALMVIQDEYVWTKAAFEKSDFGTNAVTEKLLVPYFPPYSIFTRRRIALPSIIVFSGETSENARCGGRSTGRWP